MFRTRPEVQDQWSSSCPAAPAVKSVVKHERQANWWGKIRKYQTFSLTFRLGSLITSQIKPVRGKKNLPTFFSPKAQTNRKMAPDQVIFLETSQYGKPECSFCSKWNGKPKGKTIRTESLNDSFGSIQFSQRNSG